MTIYTANSQEVLQKESEKSPTGQVSASDTVSKIQRNTISTLSKILTSSGNA
jgi:hypothetical protein